MPTMSAAERRDEAREAYNAFLAECPSHQLMARISDKWTSLIVCALADGPLRYGEVARTVASISQKMLTQTLRSLERDGIVVRTVTPEVPVRVDYELTAVGHDLMPVLGAIKNWAETHIDGVLAARAEYDR